MAEQNKITEKRIKDRKLSPSYLIIGDNRMKKAEELAAAMVCTGEPILCGKCSGCRKALMNIHPDIQWYDREGKGIPVREVRALRSDAYIRPNEAPRKVYVLAHAELLNQEGQNSLLKLIEEGPEYAHFLFLSPNPEMVLPTIRSRCEVLLAESGQEEQVDTIQESQILTEYILKKVQPVEMLPFLVSLEKKERQELISILYQTREGLIRALPGRKDVLPFLNRFEPLIAACEFNISSGHLAGWLMTIL